MSEKTYEALKILIQSVITALLLFCQTAFFSSCISNQDGTVNKSTNLEINVPVNDGFPLDYVTPRD